MNKTYIMLSIYSLESIKLYLLFKLVKERVQYLCQMCTLNVYLLTQTFLHLIRAHCRRLEFLWSTDV